MSFASAMQTLWWVLRILNAGISFLERLRIKQEFAAEQILELEKFRKEIAKIKARTASLSFQEVQKRIEDRGGYRD